MDYCLWLIEKGANLEHQYVHNTIFKVMPLSSHTVAHILVANGNWTRAKGWAEHLVRICRQVTASDGCECSCSINNSGCSTLSIFTKHYIERLIDWGGGLREKIVKQLANDLATHEAFAALIAKPLIRQLVFTLLGFRHTCCFGLFSGDYDPDDFEESRIEDAQSLETLEALVAELDTRLEQLNLPIHIYLKLEGLKRIQEVVKDLNGAALTADERNGIEEVGVRLTI